MRTEVGAVLDGRVTGITKFGAFVTLPDGKSGLVHISEVANAYVTDVHDHVHEGDTVKVKVLEIGETGKISLSIKRAVEDAPQQFAPRQPRPDSRPAFGGNRPPRSTPARQDKMNAPGDASFEDRLKQFIQDSDSKNSGNRLYEKKPVSRRKK